MIARLRGSVLEFEESAVLLDVGGVGYRVHLPALQLSELGPPGSEVELHTHLHVRETEMELFGAIDRATLALFKELLKVGGIGPKVALSVLSTLDAGTLRQAIVSEDIARLTEVPGIGRKTAQRIVLDLKSRLEDESLPLPAGAGSGAAGAAQDEALEALISLGYSRAEARRALAAIDPGQPVEARIMAALQSLSD